MAGMNSITTSFTSSPAFTDPLEDIENSQKNLCGSNPQSTGSVNTKSQSTNYGSEVAYSDILAAGLLSSQDVAGTQPAMFPEPGTAFSDYGSDFGSDDEKVIDSLFETYQNEPREQSFAKEAAIQGSQLDDAVPLAKVPKPISSQGSTRSTGATHPPVQLQGWNSGGTSRVQQSPSYYDLAKDSEKPGSSTGGLSVMKEKDILPETETNLDQEQDVSPIARFRKYRPLAVSDFVAPAWCELQYFYSLSKYGRIKRTAVMKKGTEVHRTLELEVHEYVPVEVETKEDSWGLRIWNVIQGLRALRATGVTRELDVWGVVDGEVVSGIIDEISTVCPDVDLETALNASVESSAPDPTQRTITDFWGSGPKPDEIRSVHKVKYYISDTKTRNTPTLPNEASLRQVKVQLMLYHHIIDLLSNGKVPADIIFNRYHLDQTVSFSETFLKELASLESDIHENFGLGADFGSTAKQDGSTGPPNLRTLWVLMVTEFQQTFQSGTLAPILSASFRYQADGSQLGIKSFVNDEQHLEKYVGEVLKWWKGERPARGVEIEEAFKCRICEFAEDCEWRKEKEEEVKTRRWKRGLAKPS